MNGDAGYQGLGVPSRLAEFGSLCFEQGFGKGTLATSF